MKKLVQGIVDFRKNIRPSFRETFARLALGQQPDALFISCSDSRVAVNVFASTDPGDLFVVRNVGNMIPPCGPDGHSETDESEAAAIEFALNKLRVSNIIICGHSECGAMQALCNGRHHLEDPNLKAWLRHGEGSLSDVEQPSIVSSPDLSKHNRLSQLNVLRQMEHLRSYPVVRDRIEAGLLRLHGWWFELNQAEVYAYNDVKKQFVVFDEVEAERILKVMK